VLVRSSVTEHGMAYGPRGLRSRSANSSRGRDAPPGSAGKPRAGRSGAGGGMSEPVRYARCGRPKQVTSSVEAVRYTPLESGLRSKDLRAVRRGAVGKVPGWATRWPLTLRYVRFSTGGMRKRAFCTAPCPDPPSKPGRLFSIREKQLKDLALLRPGGAAHWRAVRGLAGRAATWAALPHRGGAYRFIVVRHVHAR
jgi:hypothetical protein